MLISPAPGAQFIANKTPQQIFLAFSRHQNNNMESPKNTQVRPGRKSLLIKVTSMSSPARRKFHRTYMPAISLTPKISRLECRSKKWEGDVLLIPGVFFQEGSASTILEQTRSGQQVQSLLVQVWFTEHGRQQQPNQIFMLYMFRAVRCSQKTLLSSPTSPIKPQQQRE